MRLLRHSGKRGIPRNDNFLLSLTIMPHTRRVPLPTGRPAGTMEIPSRSPIAKGGWEDLGVII